MDFVLTKQTATRSLGVLETVKGITKLYMGIGKGIAMFLILVLILPLFLLGFSLIILLLNRTLKKELALLKEAKITTEEEYDSLKEVYRALLNVSKNKTDISNLPRFIQFILRPYVTLEHLVKLFRTELGEKLHLLPKGLTEEQIAEAAKLNKGLEHWFEDEEDEYDYSKALTLGEIEFLER
jgi:hypothetical protein